MFGKITVLTLVLGLMVGFTSSREHSDPRLPKLFARMYDSIHHVHSLKQDILAVERIENTILMNRSKIKLQSSPKKIYFINPSKKLEILYNEEQQRDKAWVKPHIFPYLTMQLDPRGNIMRKNQHYTILELGYDFIGKSIALTISKDKEGLSHFTYKGKALKNGYNCHVVEYENKHYGYVDYTVTERETASSIALKLCVNDYLLRYNNNLLNDFGYLKKGSRIKVPNLYCQKAIIFIDDHLSLPVALSLYDDKGLFESYEYSNVQVNTPITPAEFTKQYSAYNF